MTLGFSALTRGCIMLFCQFYFGRFIISCEARSFKKLFSTQFRNLMLLYQDAFFFSERWKLARDICFMDWDCFVKIYATA